MSTFAGMLTEVVRHTVFTYAEMLAEVVRHAVLSYAEMLAEVKMKNNLRQI